MHFRFSSLFFYLLLPLIDEMVDAQRRGNASEKFLIVRLPDDIDAIPPSLKNLSLPNVIVDSDRVDFETMKMSQTTKESSSAKRRKMDLTCIVCDGQASGYNFNRITCHSCKGKSLLALLHHFNFIEEFFRRNALQPIVSLPLSSVFHSDR